jgi:hypothetical protein
MIPTPVPNSRIPLTENFPPNYIEPAREEDYSKSIRVFRGAFKRLMDAKFLSGCCENLTIAFENAEGIPLKRNPAYGDLLQIAYGDNTGTFRIQHAVYRAAAINEKEWYKLRGELIAGGSNMESVISYFFQSNPYRVEITLIREGRLVYIRIEAPDNLMPKTTRDRLCERILN